MEGHPEFHNIFAHLREGHPEVTVQNDEANIERLFWDALEADHGLAHDRGFWTGLPLLPVSEHSVA